jgi:hypothetical protein
MKTTVGWALVAAGAAAALGGSPSGCASGDESTSSETTTAAGGGGHGDAGAQGGGGHGAAGGQGGGAGGLSVAEACDQACPASVACGQDGGGDAGSSTWPPNLLDCLDGCQIQLAHCNGTQLAKAVDCVTPAIDPNCNFGAFVTCMGDDAACMSTGTGGAGGA